MLPGNGLITSTTCDFVLNYMPITFEVFGREVGTIMRIPNSAIKSMCAKCYFILSSHYIHAQNIQYASLANMITPSHMIYSWAFAKIARQRPKRIDTLLIVSGGFIPDVPTYLFFFVNTFILGTSQQLMWDTLYFDSVWSPYITLSHSLLLWPLLLLFATIAKQRLLQLFSASAFAHVVLDFFVHHDDAYRHFWPLTNWKFLSPLSYYDPQYYGTWVSTIDSLLIIGLLAWLSTIYTNTRSRIGIGIIILLYVAALVASIIF